jgi:small subunit ribosomal protein S21
VFFLINQFIKEDTLVQVNVNTGNVEQALRSLKKKLQREGIFRALKLKRHFEKPSETKKRESDESYRRRRKLDRKKDSFEE